MLLIILGNSVSCLHIFSLKFTTRYPWLSFLLEAEDAAASVDNYDCTQIEKNALAWVRNVQQGFLMLFYSARHPFILIWCPALGPMISITYFIFFPVTIFVCRLTHNQDANLGEGTLGHQSARSYADHTWYGVLFLMKIGWGGGGLAWLGVHMYLYCNGIASAWLLSFEWHHALLTLKQHHLVRGINCTVH